MNNENLMFILNNGVNIDKKILEKTIYQWLSKDENDLLKIIFKYYIINHYDELNNIEINEYRNEKESFIEKIIQKSINVDNYKIVEFFIKESIDNDKEEFILKNLFNVFESDYDNYYSTKTNNTNSNNKNIKFLNSIENKELKTKIEKFLSRKKDIIEILKKNDLKEFQKFINENNIILKNLNYKKFDILIIAIECGVSSEIINYIINQVNYDTLNYCFDIINNENNEYKYRFKKNIPLFTAIAKNNFDIANLLLQNKANMNFNIDDNNFNIFQYLNDHKIMNKKKLMFILNNG
eukprot:jgi/Orpsp1_1/1188809/evm.model.d7180000067349.1